MPMTGRVCKIDHYYRDIYCWGVFFHGECLLKSVSILTIVYLSGVFIRGAPTAPDEAEWNGADLLVYIYILFLSQTII